MPDPSTRRDSTRIVLRASELDGLCDHLETEFVVIPLDGAFDLDGEYVKIIGSPVVIEEASGFLARHGVSLP